MLTYATNHHTVVDALEGVDGLAGDKYYSQFETLLLFTCAGTVEK